MGNEEITKASILKSKARMIADRNEQFAIIQEEVDALKEYIKDDIKSLVNKISTELDEE